MMYGEEIHPVGTVQVPATAMTAIALEVAKDTVLLQRRMFLPGTVLYWGFMPTVAFDYDTLTAQGKLGLYRYTKQIQTAVLGNAAGAGYAVGDLLSVTQATSKGGGILRVTGVNAGAVTTVEVVKKGVLYTAAANLATVALTGGGNNAFTVTISDLLLLDTIQTPDGAMVGEHYIRRVPNSPGDVSPTPEPPASFRAGEDLVIRAHTAATGGGGIAGDFQTILMIQHRGENFANQDLWIEGDA